MLAADISPLPQLCKSDSLSLPLSNQIPLKLGECSHNAQQQVRHGRVFPGERQVLLFKPNVNSPFGKPQNNLAKVIQIPGQAVHRVTDDGVPLPNVFHELLELGPVHVFPLSFVGEPLIEVDPFELTQLLLVESAHPQVSDRLTGTPPFCHVRFFSLHHLVSHYQKCDLCETLICHTSRVSQGYTHRYR